MREMWIGFAAASLVLAGSVPARADDAKEQKEALALVEKAIKAAGGEANLKKFKTVTWTAKGTVTTKNETPTFTMQGSIQDFDKVRLDMTVEAMGRTENMLLVVNGDKGWARHRNKVEAAPEDAI